MNNKIPMTVPLYSNTGKYKGDIDIYPISICGQRRFGSDFRTVVSAQGCALDEGHAAAGGRHQHIIEVPPGFRKEILTRGESLGVLQALGERWNEYMTPDTVHGVWKINCNQFAVIVKDS